MYVGNQLECFSDGFEKKRSFKFEFESAGAVRILMASAVAPDSMFKCATALYNNKKLERLSEYWH
jgi:hypothetical protein